jgi:hypothetical protein
MRLISLGSAYFAGASSWRGRAPGRAHPGRRLGPAPSHDCALS